MKRILIIGHAQHGKDTTAELIRDMYGLTFESSSVAASRIFLFERLRMKYGYATFQECFEDRVNRRMEWRAHISDYNRVDKAKLAKDILATSDVYVGMRDNTELQECKKQELFDMIIGVYDPRKPEDPSFDIDIWTESDFILPNSAGKDDLRERLRKIKSLIIWPIKKKINQPSQASG